MKVPELSQVERRENINQERRKLRNRTAPSITTELASIAKESIWS